MILTAWSDDIASNWVGFFGLEQIAPSWACRIATTS
jgi:hypothetical protein